MKVKIFASTNGIELEQCINDFIQNKQVIDIKYTSISINNVGVNDRALILYEDLDSEVVSY